ncbi:MAG: RNA polymerase sigma-70 factor [Macellibacteroides fermentans]|uniref:RNA polymerase sigma-70 factor n=1 Tax=Macellibacteroides fermentans TaxID=879969 RepID=UPI003ACD2875
MNVNAKSDKELVSLLIKGDESAFCDLYVRYKDRLWVFSFSLLKSEDETNDIVQEVFINLWESRVFLNSELSFSSFLFTIARNRILNYFRDIDIEARIKNKILVQSEPFEDKVESEIVYEEYVVILKKAIENLPPQRKRIFNLSRIDHFTHKEIAEQLDISVYTVQEHISESLRFIRKYLTQYADIQFSVFLFLILK